MNPSTPLTIRVCATGSLALAALLLAPPAASAQTFTNPSPITIPASGTGAPTGAPATPYPSNIVVAGLGAPIGRVAVTLHGFSHAFADDVDMLLVAPDGSKLLILSDVGGIHAVSGLTITLSDDASTALPDSAALTSGPFRPANFLSAFDPTILDPFPAPAPAFTAADSPPSRGAATFASQFGGHSGNGTWSLYVVDDAGTDVGSIAGGWSITFYPLPTAATAGQLIISEFRSKGAAGAQDEFIEIYNASGADHIVSATSGTGYGVAASDGVTRCSIPNGTIIPKHGHFLCVNSGAYSLGGYAAGDATYTTDIPDNAGIALFNNNAGGASYALPTRLDAVGSTSEANGTYKEGAGYPPLAGFSVDYSITRKTVGMCLDAPCTGEDRLRPVSTTALQDTNNNGNDFYFNDTNGTSDGFGQRLGIPGPENLESPIMLDSGASSLVYQKASGCSSREAPPNRVRDLTSDPGNNSTFGTLDLRTTWKNISGANITRLRFRIIDLSTFPAPSSFADLRPRTSSTTSITVDAYPCGTGTSSLTIEGTTLEQPPAQPNGSGFNGSLSVGAVAALTPLANNATVSVRFLIGIQQMGLTRFCVIPETLPAVPADPFCYNSTTETAAATARGDFDYDQKAEMPMYNPATGQWKILQSGSGYTSETDLFWGGPDYIPVPGDYDGDGKGDAAVYKMSTGVWSVLTSSSNYTKAFNVTLGGPGYFPQPGDYDGDGSTDISVSNGAAHNWSFKPSSTNFSTTKSTSWASPGFTSVPGQDFDGDHHDDLVAYQEKTGFWQILLSTTDFSSSISRAWGGPGYTLVPGDYNGDTQADLAVYHRMTGAWNVLLSPGYTTTLAKSWGGPGFVPVPADFDGDRKIDIAVYQASATKWTALKSTTAYTTVLQAVHGTSSDMPLSTAVLPISTRENHAGDADGDHISDLTVYNTTSGVWATLTSSSGFTAATNRGWGGTGYTPVPGDYDGDGKADLGVYQVSTGNWLVLLSSSNFTTLLAKSNGGPGYVPVPGDYDGDGKTDFVTYNTTTGLWFGLKSSTNYTTTVNVSWGGSGYTATPGDFDADGKADLALYQESTGNWLILTSSSNYMSLIARGFGGAGYVPVQADYDGDGITDFAVYQTATGIWTMLKSSSGNTLGFTVAYGGPAFTPVAGDWDGDGRADVGVYDAAGNWSILLSNGNYTTSLGKSWGGAGFTPVPRFP